MSGGLFVFKDDKTLVEMQPVGFASELEFQKLLEDHPDLLAGSQIDSEKPRRWLLITREMSVAAEQDGSGQWSLDHLFLDQDGVPTLVEVKRANNLELRRKVVAQMLDYAANGVAYWSLSELRAAALARFNGEQGALDRAVDELLGSEPPDRERFWQTVSDNLRIGRIRMLFVADYIPPELRRIVEFLNQQMTPAEVLALELRRYDGQGMRTIVPTLYGRTEEARARKGQVSEKRQWTEESFFAELDRNVKPAAASVARKLSSWLVAQGVDVSYGSGPQYGNLIGKLVARGLTFYPLYIGSTGAVAVVFNYNKKAPFDVDATRAEWTQRLASAAGVLPEGRYGSISVKLDTLEDPNRLEAVLKVFQWAIDLMKNGGAELSP